MPCPSQAALGIAIELSAVILGMKDGTPHVFLTQGRALPSGPFEPKHRTLEQGLRAWVATLSDAKLGFVEQLYTFADQDRTSGGERFVSIGYLTLVRTPAQEERLPLVAEPIYRFFPWEDRRRDDQAPHLAAHLATLRKGLTAWQKTASTPQLARARAQRIAFAFPPERRAWNDEMVLQRYELLWEAGLLPESPAAAPLGEAFAGLPMVGDHRRILATGLARLRAKIKYRPVVFELMPERFTLLELQETVEALAGLSLHKQNFRRLILSQGLVEETPSLSQTGKGRPAKLFAFRRQVLLERAMIGTKLPRAG